MSVNVAIHSTKAVHDPIRHPFGEADLRSTPTPTLPFSSGFGSAIRYNLAVQKETPEKEKPMDSKISRHKCGEWIYEGNICQVCSKERKA